MSAFGSITQLFNKLKQTTVKKTKEEMEEKFNKLISERNNRKDKSKAVSLFESETLNQHILTVNGVEVEFTSN